MRPLAADHRVGLQLLQNARDARLNSYSPYSRFAVGAAVLAENGAIFQGCNVENPSYGLTVCAERIAIFNAVSAGYTSISALAVVTEPVSMLQERMPCGACRQVMTEFMSGQGYIYLDEDTYFQLSDIMPTPFLLKKEG